MSTFLIFPYSELDLPIVALVMHFVSITLRYISSVKTLTILTRIQSWERKIYGKYLESTYNSDKISYRTIMHRSYCLIICQRKFYMNILLYKYRYVSLLSPKQASLILFRWNNFLSWWHHSDTSSGLHLFIFYVNNTSIDNTISHAKLLLVIYTVKLLNI